MLLTAPLFSKSSFFGSLLHKCRQVLPTTKSTTVNNNNNPIIDINNTIRPAAKQNQCGGVAQLSLSSPPAAVGKKTLEEKVGLPTRPKKPLTPYFRFMKETRSKVVADNPQLTNIDVVRLLSKQWGTVAPNLKERLQNEYKSDQQQYVERRAKYDSKITDEQRAEIKQLKQDIFAAKERKILRQRVKELGRPKKPASAFLRFLVKERKDTPQPAKQTYREWHEKATGRWSRLTDAEKEVFMKEARVELEGYKKEIAVWEEKMVRLGHVDVIRHGNLIDPPEPKPRK